jgi:ferredoxin, 2Fe-2S
MPKVKFLPVDLTVEGSEGESILDIALANDVPLQHACGGFCSCTTCHVIVRSGRESLSEMEEDEEELVPTAESYSEKSSRLGCQAKVGKEDVTVEIINLDI